MDANHLAGPLKVSILVHALGKGAREMVLSRLNDQEREMINENIAQMGNISEDVVEKVALEFSEAMKRRRAIAPPPKPPEKSSEEETNEEGPSSLKGLQSMDPDHLVTLIREEHPQTIAIILVHLKPDVAAEVMSRLPEEKQSDVSYRIASSEKVLSGMIEEIDRVFQDVLQNEEGTPTHKTGGIGRLAEILNQIDGASSQMIIDEIEDSDPEMAAEIKQMMFVFEDIVMVDDKGLQGMLRKVETRELAIALKAASEQVRSKIFKNMSERAAAMVREEIEGLGSVRMKEVDDAQKSVTRVIQEMEEKGELIIGGRGGESFIA